MGSCVIHRQLLFHSRFSVRQLCAIKPNASDPPELDICTYLRRKLRCSDKTVRLLLTKHPEITKISREEIEEVIAALRKWHVNAVNITRHPWLLREKASDLIDKLEMLSWITTLNENILALLIFPKERLLNLLKRPNTGIAFPLNDRIEFLCKFLKLEPSELGHHLANHLFLLTMDFEKLKNIARHFDDSHWPTEDLISDLAVFQLDEQLIKERLQQIVELKIPFETNMLKCSQEKFEKSLKNSKMRSEILKDFNNDPVAYLANRFDCSPHLVYSDLARKNIQLLSIRTPKLKEMFDFLYSNGYSPADLKNCPRILNYGLSSIKLRYAEAYSLGFRPPSLPLLCSSKVMYAKWIRKMGKSKSLNMEMDD